MLLADNDPTAVLGPHFDDDLSCYFKSSRGSAPPRRPNSTPHTTRDI